MRHVVMFSYGIGSWAAAKLVAQKHGTNDLVLLTADTNYEDEDTYKWGHAAAANVGGQHVVAEDGRDVWELFMDTGMIGNTRVDVCSKALKRDVADAWLKENCDPAETVVYIGIHHSEKDRFERWDEKEGVWRGIKHRYAALGWKCEAPLCETLIPYMDLHDWAEREGLWQQALYRDGFPHANCGGRCVKQGQGGWAHLLQVRPAAYLEVERKEEEFRQKTGKDVAILRDRRGGVTKPLPLRVFRQRLQKLGGECDDSGFGGCSCFSGTE